MTPTTTDLVLWGCAAATALLAAMLLAWFLRGDRSRGRRRCPKCWYAMEGAPTLTCPECGHDARRERRLLVTRRRWRSAFAGFIFTMIAAGLGSAPIIRHSAWRESVPDWVLVTIWPVSPDAWIAAKVDVLGAPSGMLAELVTRIEKDELSDWSAAWWTDRLKKALKRRDRLDIQDLEATIEKLRRSRVSKEFRDAPLSRIFDELSRELDIPIDVDWA